MSKLIHSPTNKVVPDLRDTPVTSKESGGFIAPRSLTSKMLDQTVDQSTAVSSEDVFKELSGMCRVIPAEELNKRQHKRHRPCDPESPMSLIRGDLSLIREVLQSQVHELKNFREATSKEINVVSSKCNERASQAAAFEDDVQDRFERETRKCDVVIRGIPIEGKLNESDLKELIVRLSSSIKVNIGMRDLVFVRNASSQNNSRNRDATLIVRFSNLAVRREFMMEFFKAKVVNVRAIGYESDQRIYISDNFTPRNAAIRKRALELKSEGKIERFIIRDGLVLVSSRDQGRHLPVKSLDELNGLAQPSLEGSLGQLNIHSKGNINE